VHIRDVRGNELSVDRRPGRVVSLVPSVTETLFDLGRGDDVVAITDYCIFPPGLTLPRVGGTKNPRVAEIRALSPDLVHMNLEENLPRQANEIEQFAPLFVSEPKCIGDVSRLILTLGEIHDCRVRAAELDGELQDALGAMPRRPFTFAVPIWKNPWMWCGGDTYVSHLVEAAGGTNVLAERERYPTVAPEDIEADVIFLPDEPYEFTVQDVELLRNLSAHQGRPAPRIIGPFPGHLFTWHGTRTILGLRWLAEVL
jgi:iron complex transport system substrate-binding protein